MRKQISMLLILLTILPPQAFAAGRIQDSDVKSLTDAGGVASRLINSTKIYDVLNAQLLSASIANGQLGGSGGGSKNYITFGTFENNASTGWSLAHSTLSSLIPSATATAGTAFSSSSGGTAASANLTFVTLNTGQLSGKYSGSLASSAATVAGDMLISQAYTIDSSDQAKALAFKFSYKAAVGATAMNLSGTSANSYAVYIYDVTNGAWIQPAGVYNLVQSSGVGVASGTFQTPSNMTQFQMAIVFPNVTTGVASLYLDDVTVGPQVSVNAPAMSDWTSFPMVINALTTNPTKGTVSLDEARWRRVGDSMEIRYSYEQTAAGTAGSGIYLFQIPVGYTIDSSKLTARPGDFAVPVVGSAAAYAVSDETGIVLAYNSTSLNIQTGNATNNTNNVGSGTLDLGNTTVRYSFNALVPITGWSSNSVASNDTDTRVVAARILLTPTSLPSSIATKVALASVFFDTHGATDFVNNRYKIPVSGKYRFFASGQWSGATPVASDIQISVYKNGVNQRSLYRDGIPSGGQGFMQGGDELDLVAGDYLELFASQNSGGTSTWGAGAVITVERLSGPAVIAATETVAAKYFVNTGGGTTLNSTTSAVVNYDGKIYDTHNAVTTGTAWKFIAPVSGKYRVSATAYINPSANVNKLRYIQFFKNGSQDKIGPTSYNVDGNGQTITGDDELAMNAGDTLQIQAATNDTSNNTTLNGNSVVTISRFGN